MIKNQLKWREKGREKEKEDEGEGGGGGLFSLVDY